MKNIYVSYTLNFSHPEDYQAINEAIKRTFTAHKAQEQTSWFVKDVSAETAKNRIWDLINQTVRRGLLQSISVIAIEIAPGISVATTYDDPGLVNFLIGKSPATRIAGLLSDLDIPKKRYSR